MKRRAQKTLLKIIFLFMTQEAEGGDQAYVKLHQLRSAVQKPLTKWPDEN